MNFSNKKGFSTTSVALGIIGIALVIVVGGTYYYTSQTKTPPEVTPADTTTVTQSTPTPETPATPPDETANWKTYTSDTYGYLIKYPTDWQIDEKKSDDQILSIDPPADSSGSGGIIINYRSNSKSQDEGSYTIQSWIDDELKEESKNIQKVTINDIEFTQADVQADPPYFTAVTVKGEEIYAIDVLTDSAKKILATFKFTK